MFLAIYQEHENEINERVRNIYSCVEKGLREYLNELKVHATEGVKPNNPAFSGFLMMMIEG